MKNKNYKELYDAGVLALRQLREHYSDKDCQAILELKRVIRKIEIAEHGDFWEPEKMTEQEETNTGEELRRVFNLEKRGDLYMTTHGNKTALGVYRTFKSIEINKGGRWEKL